MQGFRVRCALATELVDELVEAADDKQLTKTIARYSRVDLLVIVADPEDHAVPLYRALGFVDTERQVQLATGRSTQLLTGSLMYPQLGECALGRQIVRAIAALT